MDNATIDLLISKPGAIRIVSVNKGIPAGFVVSVEGMTNNGSAYEQLRAIVQSVGVAEQAAVQITHSLRDMVYVYAFGDRMGEMRIGGLALLTDCKDPNLSGFAKVYKYWRANRPGKRKTAIKISLGTDFGVSGILTGMDMTSADPKLPVANFNLTFRHFPDPST